MTPKVPAAKTKVGNKIFAYLATGDGARDSNAEIARRLNTTRDTVIKYRRLWEEHRAAASKPDVETRQASSVENRQESVETRRAAVESRQDDDAGSRQSSGAGSRQADVESRQGERFQEAYPARAAKKPAKASKPAQENEEAGGDQDGADAAGEDEDEPQGPRTRVWRW